MARALSIGRGVLTMRGYTGEKGQVIGDAGHAIDEAGKLG
jgi:hypothetical protein